MICALTVKDYLLIERVLKPLIDLALSYGDIGVDDCRQRIIDGDYLVFIDAESVNRINYVCVCEREANALHIVLLSGDMGNGALDRVVKTLSDLARDMNLKYLHCDGRKGWIRKLQRFGAKLKQSKGKGYFMELKT